MAESYLDRKASQFKDGGWETRRIFNIDILPYLGKIPAEDVTRADISMVLDKLLKRGLDRSANIVLQKIKSLYSWGYDVGIVTCVSPAYRMKKPGNENPPRTLVLSDDEIRFLFGKHSRSAQTMQLTLLTGHRNGESLITNKQIDGHWWTIPVEEYKTEI